jgi:glycosyltransferase involved in cell wall biosynthesis
MYKRGLKVKVRILILSFYYPPDIGPGPLRAESIVQALIEETDETTEISVLTTIPNRYHTLGALALEKEQFGKVNVIRFRLPLHQSGMVDQAKAFLVFAQSVRGAIHGKQWDLVLATSSRLMTAALGAHVAKQVGAKLYLDIRDLFTDTMEDVFKGSPLRVLLPFFRAAEKRTFSAADKVNVVSAGFVPHIREISPKVSLSTFTNGIDEAFLGPDFSSSEHNDMPLVLYAGNIGEGQGLHHIIPEVARALKDRVQFRIVGDGGRRQVLQNALNEAATLNVQVLNPVPRNQLFSHYRQANILFLHLNDFKAFRKVLPSKIFEYAATGKPILAGVDGYAADFLRELMPGVELFKPCDVEGMLAGLERLLQGPRMIDRESFFSRYLRKNITREMARDILALVRRPA